MQNTHSLSSICLNKKWTWEEGKFKILTFIYTVNTTINNRNRLINIIYFQKIRVIKTLPNIVVINILRFSILFRRDQDSPFFLIKQMKPHRTPIIIKSVKNTHILSSILENGPINPLRLSILG